MAQGRATGGGPKGPKPQAIDEAVILERYGSNALRFAGAPDALYERRLKLDNVVEPDRADARERYEAAARAVRDIVADRWLRTDETYARENPKRVYYLSIEFLIGRSLGNNVMNLMLDPVIERAFGEDSHQWAEILHQEPDAGLGNGGLGRLAACFLDSMATLQLPAMGYGLRYEHGIFRQTIRNGWQDERPDNWLRHPDPWEVVRPSESVEVTFGCSFELRAGALRMIPNSPSSLVGIPYDRPVIGYGGETVNTLRLWSATALHAFDFQRFSGGDFVASIAEALNAESLTRVLYPDDTTVQGRELRLMQEYFLVACSLGDIVRRFRETNDDWRTLPDKAAIQMNDTHPTLAVPELMRILLDEARLDWDEAWDITRRTLAYTNHTLLPEALERWPVDWMQLLIPRHLELIYEINRRLVADIRARFPGDEARVARTSLIEEGQTKHIRMANLAIVGSHSTNGVAAIHSRLLRTTTVKDLAEAFPERFNNKTNGVTPRRWLRLANPWLAEAITASIGDAWITDLAELKKLKPLAEDAAFRAELHKAQRACKARFADWVKRHTDVVVDPDSMFDCQIKRIHEYKRQLLNALRIVVLYDRLRENPKLDMRPRTFFFAGKAAPAYHLAKVIIKFINNLGQTLDEDPVVGGKLKVVFLPEYNVTLAERCIPAADVSNQISTAGYEASGTSNMKFMMNGALTLGTRDGATIEMAEEAGEENFFLFGLTAAEVANSRPWYSPYWHYENEAETRKALDLIFSDHFSREERGVFEPLRGALLTNGDPYMHLADLTSYLAADAALSALHRQPDEWARKVIHNIAASGKFSSDRTIHEYATEIWGAKPCPAG
ncbi:starch phosphorylase [Roseiarcus fermentans]|uniref:Alpha-1,4 glucan phosphorylase n=1 Tax=Roseiarcus fermentans TaxID=1473586 RepID=A0A366EV94_9HYPH|nr:glycogen/starch/alpha-glucan phosphorylase [Roseiarcus fermentans]RBP06254.1 starch phosphorylase [Roseiarcus fermentans]